MKTLRIILPALLLALFSCANAQMKSTDTENSVISDNIEVYYFHFDRRCETCVKVEKVTEESLKKNFPEELKNKTIVFQSINLDDKTNDALAAKLKITGQALLIVKGETSKDLTNKAFMYAVDQPEKLENAIKETINSI
jgi:hypothetical protein